MDEIHKIARILHDILARDPQWRWEITNHANENPRRAGDWNIDHYTLYSNITPIVEITEKHRIDAYRPRLMCVRVPRFPSSGVRHFLRAEETLDVVKTMINGCYTRAHTDIIAEEVERWTRDDKRWL